MFTKVVYTENYLPDLLGQQENGLYSLNFKHDLVSRTLQEESWQNCILLFINKGKIIYSSFETMIGWNASKP